MTELASTFDLLNEPYTLSEKQVEQFREQGFIKLKEVFDQSTLDYFNEKITAVTMDNAPQDSIENRDTYGKAFIQVGNIWTKSEDVKEFIFSKRLAKIATELMGTDGVRLWHDQALYKEASGGFTPWHVDQQYWPMASGKSITAWIPLQQTPVDMGALCFAKGSHVKNIGHDLEISDESEKEIRQAIKDNGLIEIQEPFDLGEVSFHYGWTLHRAGPNTSGKPRKVQTVIYMDKEMRLAKPKNENQKNDWQAWTPTTEIGEIMDDELNPVLYSKQA